MKYLVLGATSTIARAFVRELARPGDTFLLAARDLAEATALASDLEIRSGIHASALAFDATQFAHHAAWTATAIAQLGGLDGVLLCFGTLGDQARAQTDWTEAQRILEVNYTAAVAVLEPLAAHLIQQGSGVILALSSVAGVRGRQSNYHYGAAKGALTLYLEGLAHRLAPRGVRVKIALLGYVETRMSAGVPMAAPLRAKPERVARSLVRFLHSRRQSAFIPWFWWPIMTLIRALPPWLFNRSKL